MEGVVKKEGGSLRFMFGGNLSLASDMHATYVAKYVYIERRRSRSKRQNILISHYRKSTSDSYI